jgi:hypothetical protein
VVATLPDNLRASKQNQELVEDDKSNIKDQTPDNS